MRILHLPAILLLIAFAVPGCFFAPAKPQLTSLQVQAIQSRDFETSKKVAFASVMSVFQDLGYIIESANLDTGFITAKSPTRSGFDFQGTAMKCTKATAFIEELRPGLAKVRLNFVDSRETSSQQGAKNMNEEPVENPQIYQNAFTRIQEAVFIRTGFQNKKTDGKTKQPSPEFHKTETGP